jgi:hypothetical protein
MAPHSNPSHLARLVGWASVAALACLTVYLFLARWFWPAEILCHFRPVVGAFGLLGALVALGLRLRSQSLALGAWR